MDYIEEIDECEAKKAFLAYGMTQDWEFALLLDYLIGLGDREPSHEGFEQHAFERQEGDRMQADWDSQCHQDPAPHPRQHTLIPDKWCYHS